MVNPSYPPVPQTGTFPPDGPTTLTELGGMASYLYVQYADDDNLQAFVSAFNELAQIYVGWFATIELPVYTNPQIAGPLLDWVAEGVYGITRPTLSSGRNRNVGPYNTIAFNSKPPFNKIIRVGPQDVAATSDDVFKRIITWNFYKGDGNIFNILWLKRRIIRFLIGVNGTAPNIDQTDAVSVFYGTGIITIALSTGTRKIIGGALYNRFGYNRVAYNSLKTLFTPGPIPQPLAPIFKEAIESGVLILPFQYQIVVAI